jgi:glycerol uptake facilitator-like aquaporin
MAVIYLVVYTKSFQRLGDLAIGGIVGLEIFFLAFISGASMNPALLLRSHKKPRIRYRRVGSASRTWNIQMH